MKNITLSVSDETFRDARIWAVENNTSLSAAVKYILENVRTILSVHKPPRQPARSHRSTLPPGMPPELYRQMASEEFVKFLSSDKPEYSQRPSRRPSFSHAINSPAANAESASATHRRDQ